MNQGGALNLKRAKPLLGTVVEISLWMDDETAFVRATDAAFARIQTIHHAMSFHESTSDLSRIANAKRGEVIAIATDTWNTLALALDIEARSHGIFNPTVAPELVRRGLLPHPGVRCGGASGNRAQSMIVRSSNTQGSNTQSFSTQSLSSSIALEENGYLRLQEPVWIDLGGIAKGYAVDQAVKALTGFAAGDMTADGLVSGIAGGIVNAGGDLAVFGDKEHVVSVRMPCAPQLVMPVAAIRELSCATTAVYFLDAQNSTDVQSEAIEKPSHIVGVRHGHPAAATFESVSVFAPRCVIADALTKIVWLSDPYSTQTRDLLRHYQASAALINSAGELVRL